MLLPPQSHKILLSEAARAFIDLEAAFLRRAGFEVLVAGDGAQAMEIIERESPDLCVLDLAMGSLAGDEIVRRVRAKQSRHDPPHFILVSAGGAEGYERCLRSGADEVFKASGYRISPFELEGVLLEHPAVAEAAVVPSPDPLCLAVPKAFIALRAGFTPSRELANEVMAFARDKLAPYKRIRRLEFAELPKTISGKIRRVELRNNEARNRASQQRGPLDFGEEDFPELK